jgi:hypothetical protein
MGIIRALSFGISSTFFVDTIFKLIVWISGINECREQPPWKEEEEEEEDEEDKETNKAEERHPSKRSESQDPLKAKLSTALHIRFLMADYHPLIQILHTRQIIPPSILPVPSPPSEPPNRRIPLKPFGQ